MRPNVRPLLGRYKGKTCALSPFTSSHIVATRLIRGGEHIGCTRASGNVQAQRCALPVGAHGRARPAPPLQIWKQVHTGPARLLLDPKGCGAVKQERSDVSALFKGGRDIARTGDASGTVPNASQRPSPTRRCSKPSYVLSGPAAEEEQIPFTFASSNSSIGPFAAHAACRRYTCGCPTRACTFVLDLRAGMARSTNSQVTKPYPHPCSGVILGLKCQLPCSRHTFRRA